MHSRRRLRLRHSPSSGRSGSPVTGGRQRELRRRIPVGGQRGRRRRICGGGGGNATCAGSQPPEGAPRLGGGACARRQRSGTASACAKGCRGVSHGTRPVRGSRRAQQEGEMPEGRGHLGSRDERRRAIGRRRRRRRRGRLPITENETEHQAGVRDRTTAQGQSNTTGPPQQDRG